MKPITRAEALKGFFAFTALTTVLAGCAGEGAGTPGAGAPKSKDTVTIDYATYNPLSLIIRKKGWLETVLSEQNKKVEWVKSAGSNKANEALRSGNIDVGSTAGSAALLARANGSPIKVIDLIFAARMVGTRHNEGFRHHESQRFEGQIGGGYQGYRPLLPAPAGAQTRRYFCQRSDDSKPPACRRAHRTG